MPAQGTAETVAPTGNSPWEDLEVVAVAKNPFGHWVRVYRHRLTLRHWLLDAENELHPVSRAGNDWSCERAECRVYTEDGGIFYPADDPIPDLSIEREVVATAEDRLKAGAPLTLEDEARLRIARRRLAEAA